MIDLAFRIGGWDLWQWLPSPTKSNAFPSHYLLAFISLAGVYIYLWLCLCLHILCYHLCPKYVSQSNVPVLTSSYGGHSTAPRFSVIIIYFAPFASAPLLAIHAVGKSYRKWIFRRSESLISSRFRSNHCHPSPLRPSASSSFIHTAIAMRTTNGPSLCVLRCHINHPPHRYIRFGRFSYASTIN